MNTFSAYYNAFAGLNFDPFTKMSFWKGKLPKSNKRNQRRNK